MHQARPGTTLADRARMLELRVPKRRAAAEVLVTGSGARRVTLFLAEGASSHAGPEQPSDLLNGGDDFLPAFDEGAGEMTFLHRPALEVVRVARELEHADADAVTLPTEHEIVVFLVDGSTIAGLASFVRPPDRSRLVDFLNEPVPFFRVLEAGEAGAVALVNKRHVARVALVSR